MRQSVSEGSLPAARPEAKRMAIPDLGILLWMSTHHGPSIHIELVLCLSANPAVPDFVKLNAYTVCGHDDQPGAACLIAVTCQPRAQRTAHRC